MARTKPPESFIPDDAPANVPQSFVADPPPPPPPPPRTDYQPPTINRPAGPEPVFWFPGRRAEYRENQAKEIEASTRVAIAQETHAASLEMHARATDHALRTQPTRLAEMEATAVAGHAATIATHELTTSLTQKALQRGVSVATLDVLTIEQERLKNDISRASQMADIDVWKHADMKQVELDAEAQQITMKVQAALTVALVDKHKLLHIQDQVLKLIERSHAIKTSDEPDELKTAKLEVMSEVITGLRGELRGLLQGDNQERVGSGDPDSDS